MGSRKRLSLALVTAFLGCTLVLTSVLADGNIGCQFNPGLCVNEIEYCYDDNAFGRCIGTFGNIEEDDLFRFDLSGEDLGLLEKEMARLTTRGYQWSSGYTQCILQAVLFVFKTRSDYDRGICDHLKNLEPDPGIVALENEIELNVDPQDMAYVKFTPSRGNPHADFADEVYVPPLTPEEINEALALRMGAEDTSTDGDLSEAYRGYDSPTSDDSADDSLFGRYLSEPDASATQRSASRVHYASLLSKKSSSFPSSSLSSPTSRRSVEAYRRSPHLPQQQSHFSQEYNTPDLFRLGQERRDALNLNEQFFPDMNPLPLINYPQNRKQAGDMIADNPVLSDALFRDESEKPGDEGMLLHQKPPQELGALNLQKLPQLLVGFNQQYNTPEGFRHGIETKDQAYLPGNPSQLLEGLQPSDGSLSGLGSYRVSMDPRQSMPDLEPRGYTEGGMVYLPDKSAPAKTEEEAEEEALSQILSDLDPAMGWGFQRRERLDVKKPGPPFSTNNYAFKSTDDQKIKKATTYQGTKPSDESGKKKESLSKEMLQDELMRPGTVAERLYKLPDDLISLPNKKELPKDEHLDPSQYDVVDTNYAYIGFQDSVREWKDGKRIVNTVARLLHIPPETFTNIRVDRNEVTFKVNPKHPTPGLNASEVAKMIEGIKDRLKREIGVTVTSFGVGDRAKLPAIMSLVSEADDNLYVFSFILIGVVGAVVISAAALYVIRRHAASREKLQNLTAPDTEASKDYQELCRARMATKPAQETTPAAQRIASLSRESDNSPSSRSSTSSWCEEPALTNMDISTGHMVLSYMEDHLRNKDRLDQEWNALCAYEAEPCACTIAQRPENASKNRYVNALPYDHARVILNELCNFGNSDYINASTITDHDPRNPAYIATQGALSNTTPDLWQMVWEQGCVVLVMLTRLVENDVTLCHRYWPEEGSELYHIYEVHLVSEHIWCDDYLVRSFYLKNLKTGETRTVTQFHFLSWPDGGVPASIKALLEFRRKVNKSFRGRSCPIVVHCSDGVGRTGTYCLLDMVLNRMAKGAKEIDIAATLEHIRDQRMASVATKQQFQMVLAAVAEEVQAILRVLPQQDKDKEKEKEKKEEKEKDKEMEKQ